MIKSFENVYKELEYLFIQKLPEYIEKNKQKAQKWNKSQAVYNY